MIRIETPGSSFIQWFGYDAAGRQLQVKLNYGRTVIHDGVPPEIFGLMRSAKSVGRCYLKRVRGKFNVVGGSEPGRRQLKKGFGAHPKTAARVSRTGNPGLSLPHNPLRDCSGRQAAPRRELRVDQSGK
jgi:KTSC domain